MIEVVAERGEPYRIDKRDDGMLRIKRRVAGGQTISLLFSKSAAFAVADALVDIAEGRA